MKHCTYSSKSSPLLVIALAMIASACSPQIRLTSKLNSLASSATPVLVWSGATSVPAGTCSAYTVTNEKNNIAAPVLSSTSVSLSVAGSGSFYSDSSCSTPISATMILSGTVSQTVYLSAPSIMSRIRRRGYLSLRV